MNPHLDEIDELGVTGQPRYILEEFFGSRRRDAGRSIHQSLHLDLHQLRGKRSDFERSVKNRWQIGLKGHSSITPRLHLCFLQWQFPGCLALCLLCHIDRYLLMSCFMFEFAWGSHYRHCRCHTQFYSIAIILSTVRKLLWIFVPFFKIQELWKRCLAIYQLRYLSVTICLWWYLLCKIQRPWDPSPVVDKLNYQSLIFWLWRSLLWCTIWPGLGNTRPVVWQLNNDPPMLPLCQNQLSPNQLILNSLAICNDLKQIMLLTEGQWLAT